VGPAVEVQVDLQRREVSVIGGMDADALARALCKAGFEGERLAA
jgi:hypothetical protein